MKKRVLDTLNELFNENIPDDQDDQVKWECLKHSTRKCTIHFSKKLAKNTNKIIADLETKIQDFEKHYENYADNIDCKACKQQLGKIYEEKAKVINIRSKCNWQELGEKFTKFVLNLEKHVTQSQIHSVIINQDEITDQAEINKQIFSFINHCFCIKFRIKQIKQRHIQNTYLYVNSPLNKH